MKIDEPVRIDKFLWAVRLFKTRSLAAEACEKNKVLMAGLPIKPSRLVKPGDVVEIKSPPIIRSYKINHTTGNRMGAKLVPEHIEEITSQEQLSLLEMAKAAAQFGRQPGTGRPTKKDRRDLEQLMDGDWE
jgi:ribosome-associated heat shock protein Hsp15